MNEIPFASKSVSCTNCGAQLPFTQEGLTNTLTCGTCGTENYLTRILFKINPPRKQAQEVINKWRAFHAEGSIYAEVKFDRAQFNFAHTTLKPLFDALSNSELRDLTKAFGFQSNSLDLSNSVMFVSNVFTYGIPDAVLCLELAYQYGQSQGIAMPEDLTDFLQAYMA